MCPSGGRTGSATPRASRRCRRASTWPCGSRTPSRASPPRACSWTGTSWTSCAARTGRVHLLSRSPSLLRGPALDVLIAAPAAGDAPALRVLGEPGDEDRANRIAHVAQAAGTWLRSRRWNCPTPPLGALTLAPAPMRDRLVAVPTGSLVLYSDRLFHVFPLLRGFHEAEVGRAVIEALIQQALARVELGADRDWIVEALSWIVAVDRIQDRAGLTGTRIRGALGWLT